MKWLARCVVSSNAANDLTRAHLTSPPADAMYVCVRQLQGTEGRSMCIQDYYPYWHRKDRSASASKAMPIDASDASVHHIFFDDNIADTFARIVDVYDVATGKRQPELRT